MLAQRSSELDPVNHGDLITSMGQLQRIARDLQESVMSIRMMPMEYVFSRYPRPVSYTHLKGWAWQFLCRGWWRVACCSALLPVTLTFLSPP